MIGLTADEIRIVYLRHDSLYLVSSDGTIAWLVPFWKAAKTELFFEGLMISSQANPDVKLLDPSTMASVSRWMIDTQLESQAIHTLAKRLADEIAAASTAARRESLIRIAQMLLRGKTEFQVRAADDAVLTSSIMTLEMDPAARAALLSALSRPTTQN
jgi:hypothetical protein